jgi:glycosyltransferase involved in cell wall biosynthesis
MKDMDRLPLVSAVIPTRNRPGLVMRAVRSALSQSYPELQVVVVIDGPDAATASLLEGVGEPRLKVVALAASVGGSEARNRGVQAADGEWIAFLDDDDEWLPNKLEMQMKAIADQPDKNLFAACRFMVRSAQGTTVFPTRMPDRNERIDEYLYCLKKFRFGEGFLQTSTLVAPRGLLIKVPFIPGLKRGQEFAWMVRASCHEGAGFIVLPETLSIQNTEGFSDQNRVSTVPDWRSQYEWTKQNRSCFTAKAYSYCIAVNLLMDAIRCKEPAGVMIALLKDCIVNGSASPKCIFLFVYRWLVPPSVRSRVRA